MIKKEQHFKHVDLPNEGASEFFAGQLASCLISPLVMTFKGEIGAGKTTIIRAMLKKIGVQSAIKSPTFSLVESYECNNMSIHHFDLYRIHHEEELEYLGFRDYFSHHSICCIEWAEHAQNSLPTIDLSFNIEMRGVGRHMHINALSDTGKRILSCLAGE
ncbi:MAG: tRNA (adenosine(37)-N6)-threonylcarbamoyltransferase complex ATPase subunit type 1 TsaE [bacterium]|nr:tRNA (adenosine(37)-N6)-threonylcarbamoyltransferase complex ATPase subunit type 1 TsaE [bacterium]